MHCPHNKQATAKFVPRPRSLIISLGDTTDFDGYLSLRMYAAMPHTDVAYIVNFPAVFRVPPPTGMDAHADAEPASDHHFFGKGYNLVKHNFAEREREALDYTKTVWREFRTENALFVVRGGVQEINPFNAHLFFDDVCAHAPRRDEAWDAPPELERYTAVYMDMNGSAAFLTDPASAVSVWFRSLFARFANRFRGLYVMGGVYDDAPPTTFPAFLHPTTKVAINRLSAATMNQLYSPKQTLELFDLVARHGKPITMVTNNLVNAVLAINGNDEFQRVLAPFLNISDPRGSLYLQGFHAYYDKQKNEVKKPFDILSSLVLVHDMLSGPGEGLHRIPKSLHYNSEYGITLLSSQTSAAHQAWSHYQSHVRALKPFPSVVMSAERESLLHIHDFKTFQVMDVSASGKLEVVQLLHRVGEQLRLY